jgi:putative endonuclease
MNGYIYIMANKYHDTIYVGVTSNIIKRIYEHKNDLVKGFTKKYQIHNLVHYEEFETIMDAINREKQLKSWRRDWKIELIEKNNPQWRDLYEQIV